MRPVLRFALIVLLATAVLWVGLPVAAAALVGRAVGAAGLEADETQVSVTANPPLKLLLLEADSIRIQARRARWRGFTAASFDVTVAALRIGAPLGAITGHLDDVNLPDGSGALIHAQTIELAGPAETPDITIRLAPADVQAALARALPAELRGLAATVTLVPPDGLVLRADGHEVAARAAIEPGGSLTLSLALPGVSPLVITVLHPDPGVPFLLKSLHITEGMLELSGSLQVGAWGL